MFIKPGAATFILRVIAPPLCVPTTPAPAAKTRKRNLSLVLRIDALFMGGFKKNRASRSGAAFGALALTRFGQHDRTA